MLARAVALAAIGFSVFPITAGAKIPPITGWPDLATTDPDEIRRLWTHDFWRACLRPRGEGTLQCAFIAAERAKAIEAARAKPLGEPAPSNVGIHTGRLLPNGNRILVVDLDTKGKDATARTPGYPSATVNERYASLAAAIGESLPKTRTSRTASRGLHLIFQYAGDIECPSPVGLLPGVDIRARSAYILAPGSWIEGKGFYAWETGHGPDDRDLAEAPEALLRFCNAGPVRPAAERKAKPPACELDTPLAFACARLWLRDDAPEAVEGDGGRQTLKRVIQRLGDFGLSADGTLDLLNEEGGWNETKAFPSFDAGVDDSDGMTRMVEDLFANNRDKPLGCDAPRDVRDTFEAVEGVDGPTAPAPRSSPRWFFGPDLTEDMRATKCEPLIEGLIDKKTFALILGEPKQGKTHVALSMVAAISQGVSWGGRPTARGLASYFAGEGGDDVKRRALALTGGRPPSEFPFALFPGQFNVVTPAGVDQILKGIDGAAKASGFDPVTIFLDTLSRGFGGQNENESAAMGLFVAGVDKIRERTGANVTVLHHYGKTVANGARGHSLLRGAYDTCLEVAGRKVTVVEQRAMTPAPAVSFQIITKSVGPNSEGKMVETAVAEIHATAFSEPVALSAASQIALDHFDALAADSPTGVVAGAAWNARLNLARGGKGVAKATLSGWRKALIEAALIEACGDDQWTRT